MNEVYIRLNGGKIPDWQSRKHFYGIAARISPASPSRRQPMLGTSVISVYQDLRFASAFLAQQLK